MEKREVLRQYSFLLPKSAGQQLEGFAKARGVTFDELIRKSLKLGLLVLQAEDSGNGKLLWEENGETRELEVFDRKKVVARVGEELAQGE